MAFGTSDRAAFDDAQRFPEHSSALALLQKYSRLDAAAVSAEPRSPDPALLRAADAGADPAAAITVAPALSPGTPIENIQRGRLSLRYYQDRPVTVDVVAAISAAANAFDRAAWPESADGIGLQLLVAARDVEGLASAIYAYDPDRSSFTPIGKLPSGPAGADLVLQLEFADAPAIILVCGPLAASLDRHGEHGHRLLLSRAGAAANASWLTALDHGLIGSVFAGFLATALRPLVPVDGYYLTQLLALAIGHPPQRGDVLTGPSALRAPFGPGVVERHVVP